MKQGEVESAISADKRKCAEPGANLYTSEHLYNIALCAQHTHTHTTPMDFHDDPGIID